MSWSYLSRWKFTDSRVGCSRVQMLVRISLLKPFRNKPGTGRLQKRIRRAFIAHGADAVLTTRQLAEWVSNHGRRRGYCAPEAIYRSHQGGRTVRSGSRA